MESRRQLREGATLSQQQQYKKQDKKDRAARNRQRLLRRGDTPPTPSPPTPSPLTPILPPSAHSLPPESPHPATPNPLMQPALEESEWELVEKFYNELGKVKREVCDICNEIGFNMQLEPLDGYEHACKRCRRQHQNHPDLVHLYSAGNLMDPGPVPDYLPKLSEVGQAIISLVHVAMKYYRFRGEQFKYSGHILNFEQNTPKIVQNVPALPSEIDQMIVRPASSKNNDDIARHFKHSHRVRRQDILTWLQFLIRNHPDYRGLHIDHTRLSQLPEDDSVFDQMKTTYEGQDDDQQQSSRPENRGMLGPASAPTSTPSSPILHIFFVPSLDLLPKKPRRLTAAS